MNNSERPEREDLERLHSAVVAMELQLQDIGEHHPKLFGQALLSMATFLVEKIYLCSPTMEDASALLAAAQDNGLQNWIDQAERQEEELRIVTLD